jgi:hypothetical protein
MAIIQFEYNDHTFYLDDTKTTIINNYPYNLYWHNTTGPVAIYSDGSSYFYINNEIYTLEEFIQYNNLSENDITILKLKYGNL